MPRFFFDWEVLGAREVDRRGMKLPDARSAREVATDCAIDLVADDIRRGDPDSVGTILVRDEQGNFIHRITLTEARQMAVYEPTQVH